MTIGTGGRRSWNPYFNIFVRKKWGIKISVVGTAVGRTGTPILMFYSEKMGREKIRCWQARQL